MSVFDSPAFNERLFFPRGDVTPPPDGAVDDFIEVGGASLHVRYHGVSPERRTLFVLTGKVMTTPEQSRAALSGRVWRAQVAVPGAGWP